MEEWFVQQLRFTVFVPSSHLPLEEIWRLITSESPEIDESRPKEGFRRLACSLDDGVQLELQSLPGRLDISKSPHLGGGITPDVHLGDANPRVSAFANIVISLIPQLSFDISRLAFGLVLLQSTPDRIQSYKILQEKLPIELDSDSSEFMYQINHPSPINIAGEEFKLNRMSRWSAALIQRFVIQGGGAGGQQPVLLPSLVTENFVRLDIDNSTPADRTQPIDPGNLLALFKELVSLAYISAKGGRK